MPTTSPSAGDPPVEPEEPDIAGVVLAGGASRRMGRDKAGLRLPGTSDTLLERAVRHLTEAGAGRIVVATGTAGRLGPLPWDEVGDGDHAGDGPLAGLVAAFDRLVDTARVLVLAVDLPFASPPLLRWLAHELDVTGAPGLIPLDPLEHRPQPLHAAYRPGAVVDTLRRHLAEGDRRVLRAFAAAGAVQLAPPADIATAAGTDWHRNANTPLDLRSRPPRE